MNAPNLSAARIVTFTVKQSYTFDVTAERLYEALTADIGQWWDRRYMRDGGLDIELEPVAGAFMRQPLDDGGAFVMAQLLEVRPGRILSLHGTFGIPGAVHGAVRFEIGAEGKASTLSLEHNVLGDLSPEIASIFENGWRLLLGENLRAWVEQQRGLGVRAA
jgi:uncharacterized protein YndB with AHSA1/START domain